MTAQQFVLLDRDGTIITERHYLADPGQVELIGGVADGLRRLSLMGLGLVVITNQSGVGRGFFDVAQLALIHQRLRELLSQEGVHLHGIYYCPHTPTDNCQCRKPRIGLVELAAGELGFDPQRAFVIGDQVSDIELGKGLGAMTFLVRTGYGDRVAAEEIANPDYIVADVFEAALVIERLLVQDERTTRDGTRARLLGREGAEALARECGDQAASGEEMP